jgi:hypothetical protein
MRGIARVGRRGSKALKRRKLRRPWDASEGVSKPWRCPASPPDRPAPCFLPDATQGRSHWVIIIKIWYYTNDPYKGNSIAVFAAAGVGLVWPVVVTDVLVERVGKYYGNVGG